MCEIQLSTNRYDISDYDKYYNSCRQIIARNAYNDGVIR